MCGITGLILGNKDRTKKDLENKVFEYLNTPVPPTTTTTTTIPEDTEIDTTSRSAGITNQFGKPPREREFEQSDFYKLLNPMLDSPTEPDRPLKSDMSLVDKGNEAYSNIPVGPITQKIRDGNTPIQMLIDWYLVLMKKEHRKI